jgi:hypothetical protein
MIWPSHERRPSESLRSWLGTADINLIHAGFDRCRLFWDEWNFVVRDCHNIEGLQNPPNEVSGHHDVSDFLERNMCGGRVQATLSC